MLRLTPGGHVAVNEGPEGTMRLTGKRIAALAGAAVAAVVLRDLARTLKDLGRLRSRWVTVRGMRLHALVSSHSARPDVPPVVLVHGYGISSSYFIPTAARLAPVFPVYAPDLPGHGRSDKPARVLDVGELAEVLRDWMDAVGIERAALVGNSMGCQIVTELAARWPQRVERLVLIGPTADRAKRTVRQHLLPFLVTGRAERPSLNLLLLLDYARARPHRIVRELRHMLDDRIEQRLPRIAAPSMVVRGEKDRIVPQRWAEEVARLLGTDRLVVIPGYGHAVNYSAPDDLVAAIRPFLREGWPAGAREAVGAVSREGVDV